MHSKAPTRIVDTHQHVFWHNKDDQGLIEDLNQHKIDLAWLLTWEIVPEEDNQSYHSLLNPIHRRSDGTHAGIPLSDIVQTQKRYPERFLSGYCPHPCYGDAPGLLRAAAKIHNVRICGEWKFRIPFDDPRSIELFRAAGELKMPVVLHLDIPWLTNAEGKKVYQPNWYGGTVDNLERALIACPETIFIGHAPGFWREISSDASDDPSLYPEGPVKGEGRIHQLFDRYPNLYADLSAGSGRNALKRDPAHALQFLKRFHTRLLFARDYYEQELHHFLQTLDLPSEVIEAIYHQNAERIVPPINLK